MARTGKIARLPFELREQLNDRLLNNEGSGTLLPWLNKAARLEGDDAVTDQNLSGWRMGGFAEWMERHERILRTRSLAEYCRQMADGDASAPELSAAIVGGQLMESLESFDAASIKELLAEKPEKWIDLVHAIARLQSSRADAAKARQSEVALRQAERKLELMEKQFQVKTCELFLRWAKNEKAIELATQHNVRPAMAVEKLRQLMFGEVVARG